MLIAAPVRGFSVDRGAWPRGASRRYGQAGWQFRNRVGLRGASMTHHAAELSLRDALPETVADMARFRGASGSRADAVLFLVCMLALAGVAAVCAVLGSYLYMGTAKPGLPTTIEVACRNQPAEAGSACNAQVQDLGFGRWRVALLAPPGPELIIALRPVQGEAAGSPVLLMRTGYDRLGTHAPADLRAAVLGGAEQPVLLTAQTPPPRRTVIPIDSAGASDGSVRLSIRTADSKPGAIILEEIGLFRSEADISRVAGVYDLRSPKSVRYRQTLQNAILLFLGLVLVSALAGRRWTAWYVPLAIGLASMLASLALLLDTNGPEWALDLSATLAGGTILEGAGANLNYGIHMAQSVLKGEGPLIAGVPPWHRMPGYGYFIAAGSITGDLLRSGLNSIFLQAGFVSLALALLVAAVSRMAPLGVAALAGALLAVSPGSPYYTLIEAMAPGLAYLVLAAACLFIADVQARGSARLSRHLALHAAFALWFSFRVDVLPGWALVSLLLYAWPPRRWPMLGMPALFMLAVGVPWGLFKQRYTGEFSMTTNSAGASLMVGLWEVPHPFVWTVDDGSYGRWAEIAGLPSDRKVASDAAVRETLRFWLTYPGYLVSLVWHEFMQFWSGQMAPGIWYFSDRLVRFSPRLAENMPYLRLASLAVIAVAVFTRYRPVMVLLLGWIVFFNAPLYFLVYSSAGRFYNVALAAVLLLTVLLLCDVRFYRTILKRPWAAGITVAVALAIALGGQKLDDYLIAADGFRFRAPFLDPAQSRLAVWKAVEPPREDSIREPSTNLALTDLIPAQATETAADGEGIRVMAPAGRHRPLAAVPLPPDFLGFHHCRIRMELKVSHGKVAIGIETPDGAPSLLSEPVRPLAPGEADFMPLDFNVPIGDRAPAAHPAQISLSAVGGAATDITLRRAVVHGCTRSS